MTQGKYSALGRHGRTLSASPVCATRRMEAYVVRRDHWARPRQLIAPYSLEINSSLVLNSQLARYRQVLIQTRPPISISRKVRVERYEDQLLPPHPRVTQQRGKTIEVERDSASVRARRPTL